jgi:glutamyl/glutaminyl-tRNA synthetase
MDFDKKFQDKLFTSQKGEEYKKWLKLLLSQKDAYQCFCKSYSKCLKNCCHSVENTSESNIKDLKQNSDVLSIRFKNNNSNYMYYNYLENKEINFSSEGMEDFILFKNFNNQFTESFKRVVDDNIFGSTHILEFKKKFNPFKNAILTKHLLFQDKKYIELPEIKIKYWNKEKYTSIGINYLKSRMITDEALLNEVFLLGHKKHPKKEYKELVMRNVDMDLVKWDRINLDVRN